MATIVIGIGNPVRSDDAVGLHAVRRIARAVQERPDVRAQELHVGGIRLMEAMIGYDRAIVIDAIQTEGGTPGAIYQVAAAELFRTRNSQSSHDASLAVALEVGEMSGLQLPDEIAAWAVEASDVESFSEELTPAVKSAVPQLVAHVLRQLGEEQPLRSAPE